MLKTLRLVYFTSIPYRRSPKSNISVVATYSNTISVAIFAAATSTTTSPYTNDNTNATIILCAHMMYSLCPYDVEKRLFQGYWRDSGQPSAYTGALRDSDHLIPLFIL